jgi:hypothetical protein
MSQLAQVFQNAALPQKLVLILLLASIPATITAAALAWRTPTTKDRSSLLADLSLAAPPLGLLVAAMGAFHMWTRPCASPSRRAQRIWRRASWRSPPLSAWAPCPP